MRRFHPFRLGLPVAAVALALDQASKTAALTWLMDPPRVMPVTPFLNFVLSFNTGVTFGLGRELGVEGAWLLAAVAVAVVALLLRWLARAGDGALDGVVAKRLDEPYRAGERAMLKIKSLRSADCVVGGFRYATAKREVGSLLLGLYNGQGLLDHVGFTSAIDDDERAALTRKLERLRGAPGFTGDAPGGPDTSPPD